MKKILVLIFSFFCIQCSVFAIQDNKYAPYIAIMTDHILDPPTAYYNYPASSELFANAIVNELRLRKNTRVLGASDVKEIIKMTTLTPQLKQFTNQYRINYNIDFTKVRPFAKALGVDNILLITSDIDYQNYFLKGTIWNLINFPGADVVNPVYHIVTNVVLIDVKNETIVWQNIFKKNLKARDDSIIPTSFAPNTQQLKAVNDYSKALSYQVANAVEEHTCPYLYFDSLGNRYNQKSNSIIGKTKYYTRENYEKYVGVDVPGPPVADRIQEYKENYAKYRENKKQENAIKKEQKSKLQQQQAQHKNLMQDNNKNNYQYQNYNLTDNNFNNIETSEQYIPEQIIAPNPIRDYVQNDSIHIEPDWTPNAYGNRIEDL